MLLAYEHGKPIGFISGVETTHPDKGTEMFVYELAVDERFRRRGCGSALVLALARLARERGCYAMWVLADQDNAAAIATYERAGGRRESTPVMLSWDFSGRD
jgi:ribosomal protein S18 acetylase RimI-like enzyme